MPASPEGQAALIRRQRGHNQKEAAAAVVEVGTKSTHTRTGDRAGGVLVVAGQKDGPLQLRDGGRA
jgi:hypothetical protein